MKLYIIQNEYKTSCYVVANNIEEAILKFKKISDLEIISIQYISKEIIVGEQNE